MSHGCYSPVSAIVVHGFSCATAYGIFLDQGSNPCLLHWQVDSLPSSHQGSPGFWVLMIIHSSFIFLILEFCFIQLCFKAWYLDSTLFKALSFQFFDEHFRSVDSNLFLIQEIFYFPIFFWSQTLHSMLCTSLLIVPLKSLCSIFSPCVDSLHLPLRPICPSALLCPAVCLRKPTSMACIVLFLLAPGLLSKGASKRSEGVRIVGGVFIHFLPGLSWNRGCSPLPNVIAPVGQHLSHG